MIIDYRRESVISKLAISITRRMILFLTFLQRISLLNIHKPSDFIICDHIRVGFSYGRFILSFRIQPNPQCMCWENTAHLIGFSAEGHLLYMMRAVWLGTNGNRSSTNYYQRKAEYSILPDPPDYNLAHSRSSASI